MKSRSGMKWTNREVAKAKRLLDNEGLSIEAVAKRLGRTKKAVQVRLSLEGVVHRGRTRRIDGGLRPKDIRGYKLEVGKEYVVRTRDARGWHMENHRLTCVKNYNNYIRFRRDGGTYECYLKVDMLSNSSMVKEL